MTELHTVPARKGRAARLTKGQAIKTADKEDSYNTGLRQFLDEKSYKPTFEPFKLGTMLTDQRRGKN